MELKAVPVGELIDATRIELVRVGYTELSRTAIERTWNQLEEYAHFGRIESFSREVARAFLDDRYQIDLDTTSTLSASDADRLRSINLLLDFQKNQAVSIRRKRRQYRFAPQFEHPFGAFMHHRQELGFSHRTLESDIIYLERFSAYLDGRGVRRLADVDNMLVLDFLRFSAAKYSKATVYCTSCLIRVLLRFLYEKNLTTTNLAIAIPKLRYDKQAKAPSTYTPEEIQRLLEAVDRGNPKGKRDYAILMIASRLGLRAGDICGLTFNNFRWDTNTIEFPQQKTGVPITLPLLNDVGEAMIDYLRHGRPSVETDVIFLRLHAPVSALKAPTIHSIVTQYMNKARIDIPKGKKHGPHALRHSLAGAMLRHHTPLPVIADVLGHSDTTTASTYLKIDVPQLRALALEVPSMQTIWMGGEFA